MADILRLVSAADRRTLPTLSQLSENDIKCIWAEVSAYIGRLMTLQKGVHVAGLGTFTFSQQTLNIGNKLTIIQRPIFTLAGKLVNSLGLKQTRPPAAATNLPVVQLNFAAVSQETPFSRDIVGGCIRETLLLLSKALASEQNVLLNLQGIGVLHFRNNKVCMVFSKDFLNAMDERGSRQMFALNSRTGSSVSLLSGGVSSHQRPQTTSLITLPTVCSPQPDDKAADRDPWCPPLAPDQRNAGEVSRQRGWAKSHLQPVKVKPFSLSEELNSTPPKEATDKPTTMSIAPWEEFRVTSRCSDHPRAGQELCYLCMHRAQRNVPVSLKEQQQAEEKAQEKLLVFQEQQRVKQHMDEQEAKQKEQREHAKQVARFNLRMSEKKRENNWPLLPTSFILSTRPLTPAKRIQQHRYMNELQSQIESRRKHETQDQQNRLQIERQNQVQLAQEIALQRAEQHQRKHERTKSYKEALDSQVEDKSSTEAPQSRPASSWFSRCRTAANDAESRERAHKLSQVNFSAANQRKIKELHEREEQLDKEKEILNNNKMELISASINRFERKSDIMKSLQDEWSRSAKLKHQREEEERRFLRSAGQVLVDKLGQYKRCCQCQRKLANCGESNIWKDSYYLAGSQFMI